MAETIITYRDFTSLNDRLSRVVGLEGHRILVTIVSQTDFAARARVIRGT